VQTGLVAKKGPLTASFPKKRDFYKLQVTSYKLQVFLLPVH